MNDSAVRHKLQEAKFFLGFLADNYGKEKKFDFYLSAFFGAARAVIWIMGSEFDKVDGYREWIASRKVASAAEERLLGGITDARNRSQKSKPLRTFKEAVMQDLYTDTGGSVEAEKIMQRIVREKIVTTIGGTSGKYTLDAVLD